MAIYNGMPITISDKALEATAERLFPESRHRSARIHKKLVKRHGGEFRMVPCIWQTPAGLVMHPERFAELRRAMAGKAGPWPA